jgi:hypothetical protein
METHQSSHFCWSVERMKDRTSAITASRFWCIIQWPASISAYFEHLSWTAFLEMFAKNFFPWNIAFFFFPYCAESQDTGERGEGREEQTKNKIGQEGMPQK